jgi:hypothetical protein
MESNDGRRPVDMAKYGECRELLQGVEAQRKREKEIRASRERELHDLGKVLYSRYSYVKAWHGSHFAILYAMYTVHVFMWGSEFNQVYES